MFQFKFGEKIIYLARCLSFFVSGFAGEPVRWAVLASY